MPSTKQGAYVTDIIIISLLLLYPYDTIWLIRRGVHRITEREWLTCCRAEEYRLNSTPPLTVYVMSVLIYKLYYWLRSFFYILFFTREKINKQVLNQVGVISGNDITPEAALAKLSYVLSKDDWDLSTKRMVSTYCYGIHFKLFNLYVCQTNHSCCVKILFLLLPAFINLLEFSLPPPNHYSRLSRSCTMSIQFCAPTSPKFFSTTSVHLLYGIAFFLPVSCNSVPPWYLFNKFGTFI